MLRKVKVETSRRHAVPARAGDGRLQLPPGERQPRQVREDRREGRQRVTKEGTIVPKDAFEQANAQIEAAGKEAGQGQEAEVGPASTLLLGITKASVQSSASSRPPASRKRPRCSPKRPWPARSIPGRPEGKRDPRPLDPGRHRLPHVPRFGSPLSPRSAAGPQGREDRAVLKPASRCWPAAMAMVKARTRTSPPRKPAPSLDALFGTGAGE